MTVGLHSVQIFRFEIQNYSKKLNDLFVMSFACVFDCPYLLHFPLLFSLLYLPMLVTRPVTL